MSAKAIIETVDQISKDTLDIRGVFTDEISFKTAFSLLTTAESDDAVTDELRRSYKKSVNQQSLKVTIKPGEVIDLSDPIVIPPQTPTQEEIDKAEYFKQVNLLLQFRQALSLTSTIVTDQEKLTESLFKVDYYK